MRTMTAGVSPSLLMVRHSRESGNPRLVHYTAPVLDSRVRGNDAIV
jgi:hypothetical protein